MMKKKEENNFSVSDKVGKFEIIIAVIFVVVMIVMAILEISPFK